MVDIDFLSQLVESMNDAARSLEVAVKRGDKKKAEKLKIFIFDLHRQIELLLSNKPRGRRNV